LGRGLTLTSRGRVGLPKAVRGGVLPLQGEVVETAATSFCSPTPLTVISSPKIFTPP